MIGGYTVTCVHVFMCSCAHVIVFRFISCAVLSGLNSKKLRNWVANTFFLLQISRLRTSDDGESLLFCALAQQFTFFHIMVQIYI